MKPLSKNKRRGYFIFFCVVFIIAAPLFVLNARGYRLNWGDVLKISPTGGLYISTDQSGIEIYVDHILVRETSMFQRNYFAEFKPGVYEINVSKEGLQSWSKKLEIYPEMVTEARSFLMKSSTEPIEIPRLLDTQTSEGTTSSKKIPLKNPEYDIISASFLPPPVVKITSTKGATTSPDYKTLNDILVKNEAGKLHVFWTGKIDSIPNYFCEDTVCKPEIIINTASRVLSYDFFPGKNDLLILRLADGIYVSEIDDRSPQNIQKIVSEPGYDFRIKDGKIYLKKDEKIYVVSL